MLGIMLERLLEMDYKLDAMGALLNLNEILLNVRTAYVMLDIMQERLLTRHFA
jgi:hypothetical protein